MRPMTRREALQASGVLALAGLAGCSGTESAAATSDAETAAGGSARGSAGSSAEGLPTPFVVPQSTIPVLGRDEVFPVRRIYCIGRNYAAHAIEMGSDPTREPPFFFQKPTDAIQLAWPGEVLDHSYPPLTRNYHYEVELVVALRGGGRDISPDEALDRVYGYAVGLDMTRRDLQLASRAEEKPWEIGKSFDNSAVLGPLHHVADVGHFHAGRIRLSVNGEVKQEADLEQMIWNVAEQISQLSQGSELRPGDIIYSGTPENVGPVVVGDLMEGHIDGLTDIAVRVV
ncbi:MAG: FAA hydrolase family protein [Gemmatimonadales bacterium]|nr:MAG: FAA hydrolase family protein [Gemmatimonadales bacterium]